MTRISYPSFLPMRKSGLAWLIMGYCLLVMSGASASGTVFTYRVGESEADVRHNYEKDLLQLALEKTRKKFGSYQLKPTPAMSARRGIADANANRYPNFMIKRGYQSNAERNNLIFVRFPVDLGILGYRVCFISPQAKEQIGEVSSLDDLRKFTIGQGSGWSDVQILRHSGFRLVEIPSYESLFRMVAINRFDLFCRGANEVFEEVEGRPSLILDETFALAYPKPVFFHTHESNRQAAERIEEGLKLAYRDGSLQKLWRKHYMKSVDFVKLNKRKIFWLENPLVHDLDFNYQQYFYDPHAVAVKPSRTASLRPR